MDATAPATRPAFVAQLGQCPTHGAYPLNVMDADGTERWYAPHCPVCSRQRGAQVLMRRAAIPPRFEYCGFDNYIAVSPMQKLALEECRRYADQFATHLADGTGLILRGNPGTGKNHLASAIARQLIARGHSVLNATAHDIVRRIRDTWERDLREQEARAAQASGGVHGTGPQTEAAIVEELAALDLLIIDEVGRNYRSRSGAEPVELFHVIDARYRRLRPTLILSNLPLRDIRSALGEAAYDRLREGGCGLLNFEWASSRPHVERPQQRMHPPANATNATNATSAINETNETNAMNAMDETNAAPQRVP